jgi:hypothetical protein
MDYEAKARDISSEWRSRYETEEDQYDMERLIAAALRAAVEEERREFLAAVQRVSLGFTEYLIGDDELMHVESTARGVCDALERWIRAQGGA